MSVTKQAGLISEADIGFFTECGSPIFGLRLVFDVDGQPLPCDLLTVEVGVLSQFAAHLGSEIADLLDEAGVDTVAALKGLAVEADVDETGEIIQYLIKHKNATSESATVAAPSDAKAGETGNTSGGLFSALKSAVQSGTEAIKTAVAANPIKTSAVPTALAKAKAEERLKSFEVPYVSASADIDKKTTTVMVEPQHEWAATYLLNHVKGTHKYGELVRVHSVNLTPKTKELYVAFLKQKGIKQVYAANPPGSPSEWFVAVPREEKKAADEAMDGWDHKTLPAK